MPGAGLRATLVSLAVGGGLALTVALLGTIDAWHHWRRVGKLTARKA